MGIIIVYKPTYNWGGAILYNPYFISYNPVGIFHGGAIYDADALPSFFITAFRESSWLKGP